MELPNDLGVLVVSCQPQGVVEIDTGAQAQRPRRNRVRPRRDHRSVEPTPHGVVECDLESHATFAGDRLEPSRHIGVKGDGGSHSYIIAAR